MSRGGCHIFVRAFAPALLIALIAGACSSKPANRDVVEVSSQTSSDRAKGGPAAQRYLAVAGFDWQLVETAHARIHVPRGSHSAAIASRLADSVEMSRRVALDLLGEPARNDEPKVDAFFVDSRDDMRRIVGQRYGGFAHRDEMTAVFVAGPGYRPFVRHELTHVYSFARWGRLATSEWISEGLAALAEGPCQGHTIDALAAGYVARKEIPSLDTLTRSFRSIPELPGYYTAGSLVDFIRSREGIVAIRAIWQGTRAGFETNPLGPRAAEIEREWRAYLATVVPATLDVPRLDREGC